MRICFVYSMRGKLNFNFTFYFCLFIFLFQFQDNLGQYHSHPFVLWYSINITNTEYYRNRSAIKFKRNVVYYLVTSQFNFIVLVLLILHIKILVLSWNHCSRKAYRDNISIQLNWRFSIQSHNCSTIELCMYY